MTETPTNNYKNRLVFFVNGQKVEVINPDPRQTLLQYLRKDLRLTGTKLACGEGGCGACTVMVARYSSDTDDVTYFPVNACLAPVCSMHGLAVTTVEGIGSLSTALHPVQSVLAEHHGSQCGFCTPGIVMSMYTLLQSDRQPASSEIQENFDGNLCRCTGYRPILQAYNTFAAKEECTGTCEFCPKKGTFNDIEDHPCKNSTAAGETQKSFFSQDKKHLIKKLDQENLEFRSPGTRWFSPTSLGSLLEIRRKYRDCKLVNGNTEVEIEVKFKKANYQTLVSVTRINQLKQVIRTESGIEIGASLPLSQVKKCFEEDIRQLPEYKTRGLTAFVEMLKWFAGHQIRSVACLAGNIMTASPISDLNPLLLACRAKLKYLDLEGATKEIFMDQSFFTGYKKTCLEETDTIVSVLIPYTTQAQHMYGYKQANRKEDDISIVNAGMWVELVDNKIHEVRLAFGGMHTTTLFAIDTMTHLKGRAWDESILETAKEKLPGDLKLLPGAPGGMVAYRRTLTISFFQKFYLAVTDALQQNQQEPVREIISHGSQVVYGLPFTEQRHTGQVGQPLVHVSAKKQTTGEAIYVDDLPAVEGQLYAGFVTSTSAHANVTNVDVSSALATPGVVGYVCYKDVPGSNNCVLVDPVFAPDKVVHEGQVIGVVVAESLELAKAAAKKVKVTYEVLAPIITIKEAIKANSYYDNNQQVRCGHVTDGFSSCDQTVEGELSMGAQEHFYLEPHACIVSPRDTDEYHVTCMTQNLDAIHTELAQVLGISQSQITVSVKRIGGGFGGKETRHGSVVFPVAVAAHKYKRPVRAVLDRDEDMRLTGTRHPILAKYKVGFNKNGKLVALEAEVYFNAGSSLDMSAPVSERCILTMSNAYKIPNVHIQGKLCRTNIASNTAFRGFGTPQAVFIMESIMDHVATTLGMDPVMIRELNFYKQGDQVAYGQVIEKSHLMDCWEECKIFSNYEELKTNVENFNKANTNKKRGIALSPLTYGIGYPLKLLNKGSAQVNVYRDGSVLLLTSGVEMGQGLNTKMIQIASQVLNVDVKFIRVPDTSTDTAPNSSPTAGSMTSDLIGPAVVNACNEIKDKLKPLREAKPDLSWEQLVNEAIDDRKYLSAIGFYVPEVNGMDWSKTVNSPFQYYSFGACCSVVEIDCLNGDHMVLSTHIVMDVGHSLNTAIDIGQIEGAFLQGYGLMCLEQYKMSAKGSLLSFGPGTYKIPSFSNIPKCFNVALLKNKGNPKAVYSSKAIGEPPLCLSVSVLMAIKSAIQAARPQRSAGHFFLHAPATPDRIRMGCDDDLAQMFTQDAEADAEKPFFVVL